MTKTLTLGQIGCGYWGPNLLRTFRELPGARLKWLCDLKPGRLEWARERNPGLQTTEDYRVILSDPEVDAVLVATEVVTHHALARAALEAGKHVFVEKPLTNSTEQARDLAALAKGRGLTLGVGHVFLYHPAFRALKAALVPERLGRLYAADLVRINPGPPAPKHNVLWDMAPHDVAMAIDLAGCAPVMVRASGHAYQRPDVADAAFMELHFPGNVLARVHVSWLSSRRIRRVEVYAERGSAFYDDTESFEKVRIVSRGEDTRVGAKAKDSHALYYGAGDIHIPALPPEEPLRKECADFLDAVREGRQPFSGPDSGVRVVEVLEAACESLKHDGEAVKP